MISVITPTLNRKHLLKETIWSVKYQSYSDWEMIIVDDGSTDGTEEEIQPFLTDPRIKYVRKENTGQAHSLNVGVTYAKGDFITFLDSDDVAYCTWLEEAAAQIDDSTGIICAEAIRRFANGKMVKEGLKQYKYKGLIIMAKFTCGSLFIRKPIFEAIGGYDHEMKSNIQTDLGYRLLHHITNTTYRLKTIQKPLVQINVHSGPRVRTNWKNMRTGAMQFVDKHFDFFYKYDPQVLSFFCGCIAYYNYRLHNRQEAAEYMMKAIRYNPRRLINYMRFFKYYCL